MGSRDELLENCRMTMGVLCDYTAIEKEIEDLRLESEVVSELARKAIYEKAQGQEQDNDYMQRYDSIIKRLSDLKSQQLKRREKEKLLKKFIRDIKSRTLVLEEFDEKLWLAVVEKAVVHTDGRVEFYFKDGSCVEG